MLILCQTLSVCNASLDVIPMRTLEGFSCSPCNDEALEAELLTCPDREGSGIADLGLEPISAYLKMSGSGILTLRSVLCPPKHPATYFMAQSNKGGSSAV